MKKHSLVLLSLSFCFFILHAADGFSQESAVRTWTSPKGTTIEAELIELEDGVAVLRIAKGKPPASKSRSFPRKTRIF